MPFPKTITELVSAGYKFSGNAQCKGCGASIQFWQTPKLGKDGRPKTIPLNMDLEPHFATCPKAKDFRK